MMDYRITVDCDNREVSIIRGADCLTFSEDVVRTLATDLLGALNMLPPPVKVPSEDKR